MAFEKDFNELLDDILTDYRNAFGEAPDRLLFLRSACLASALWGLYRYQKWISRQIFPDTADSANLDHHAWMHGLTRLTGETDSALLARLLNRLRRPAAGGNRYDYEAWAKETEIAALQLDNPTSSMLSSAGMDDFSAPAAVDLNTDTVAWRTNTSSPGAYVLVDAGTGRGRHFCKVRLFLSGAGCTASYHVQYSNDGLSWASATTGFVPTMAGWNEVGWESVGVHRYWRLYLSNTPEAGPDVCEMEWYAGPESVAEAKCIPIPLGPGTVDVVITGSVCPGQASDALVDAVAAHIEDVRPVTANETRVLSATVTLQGVALAVYGSGANVAAIEAEIRSYVDGLSIGEILYKARLVAIAMENGATNAVVNTPANDVDPGSYGVLRSGTIEVVQT